MLNSIEDLYQIISGTLPEGYVRYCKNTPNSWINSSDYGMPRWYNYYIIVREKSQCMIKIDCGVGASVTTIIKKYS